MTKNNLPLNKDLFIEIKELIEESRQQVAQAVNAGLTAMYWNIGKLIREDILQNSRADYGQNILQSLSEKLVQEYGNSFSVKNLHRMTQFNEVYPEFQIVATLWRQLSWSHFKILIPLKTDLEREFYAQMCRIEKWSVRTLRKKIDSMLFERTAISKKPEELAKLELKQLKEEDKLSPDLVFRNHYVLDFLNLKDTYAEKDLNIVTIVRNEFNKIKKVHPEVIERVKELPNRTKTAKLFSENNTVVFRKKGMALFSLVTNYEGGKIKISEKNFQELFDSVKCSFYEKRLPLSKRFWKSYEKIKEYKPQYKSGSSELAIEKKASNSLKSLLKQKKDELNQTYISFIDTLLKDIKRYKTLSTNTLRKLILPDKTSKEPYDELIQNIENLRRKIGSDYLEIILKKATNIEDDIIIAVENKTK